MKAYEVMATLNDQKQLLLDDNLDIDIPSRVKVILLVSDETCLDFFYRSIIWIIFI